MKAAVCRAFGQPLVVEDLLLDPPRAGEVKVRLSACAICHSDISYLQGKWGGALPAVYGHEAAGVVAEVGPQVTSAKLGDHVVVTLLRSCGRCFFCAQGSPHLCEGRFALDRETRLHAAGGEPIVQGLRTGGFAQEVVVDQSQIVAIPAALPMDIASLLACGVITGVGAVTNTAQVPAGSSVVVIGVGGVGLNSLQGAHLAGAQPIVAIDVLANKLDAAMRFGATHAVNSRTDDAPAIVQSLTGRGADYVFIAAGSAPAIELGLRLMRRGGTLVMVGMPAAGVMTPIEMGNIANDSQRILGSKMGSTRLQVDVPKLVRLYQQGRLKLDELITARYPLDAINQAVEAAVRGDALRNVIYF